jgi:esterase/lipase
MEFLTNIGNWFVINKDTIIGFVLSGQFATLLGAVVLLVRNLKSTKNNTEQSKTLNASLEANKSLIDTSKITKENSEFLKSAQDKLKNQVTEFEDKIDAKMAMVTDKINAMLEVQSIVYSTIKDEKVSSTVNNLLVNAKYAETATRAELQKQVEELKAKVAEQVEQLNKTVETVSDNVVKIVKGDNEPVDETVTRY